MKSIFESVVQRCTKYLQAMTSRQALAKMFMYASITHCQGKITQRALALWHLHSWHLDVPPKACNSRREIQGPKGPVLSCQSTPETIGNNSTLKKLAPTIKKLGTCQGLVSLLILASPSMLQRKPDFGQLIASACGLLVNPLKAKQDSFC